MRLNHIRDFIAVAEAGSMRAAARSLALSQPALTKSIRQLETELGGVLLSRGVRGTRPTDLGQAFLARARAITLELSRAREEIEQLRGGRSGRLSIGCAPAPALGLVPIALPRLRRRWPAATISVRDVSAAEVPAALREGTLDVALSVRVGPLAEAGADLLVEPLYGNAARIISRRGHPLAGARFLAELSGAEWVRTGGSDKTSLLPEAFRAAGLQPPRYRVECGSLFAVPEIVAQSDLLAVVPWQLARREAAAGHVAQIALRETLSEREICLCRRADLPLTPIAAEFAQIARNVARRLARA